MSFNQIHSRGYLTHVDGADIQFITYRLVDALPKFVIESFEQFESKERVRKLYQALSQGKGSCVMNDSENAQLVVDNWRHFDGVKYELLAYVVMPNHVHVLIKVLGDWTLASIIHSWKSFTAKKTSVPGYDSVWYRDYFDRYIRDDAHLNKAVHYILQNPVKAGLVRRAKDWPWSWKNDAWF